MYYDNIYSQLFNFAWKQFLTLLFAQISGNPPCFLLMSNGKMSDIRAAKENIPILPDSCDKKTQKKIQIVMKL